MINQPCLISTAWWINPRTLFQNADVPDVTRRTDRVGLIILLESYVGDGFDPNVSEHSIILYFRKITSWWTRTCIRPLSNWAWSISSSKNASMASRTAGKRQTIAWIWALMWPMWSALDWALDVCVSVIY